MFSGKDEALSHRDAVLDAFHEAYGEGHGIHIRPVLDGAILKVQDMDPEDVQQQIEAQGFRCLIESEGGEWSELKVKPE